MAQGQDRRSFRIHHTQLRQDGPLHLPVALALAEPRAVGGNHASGHDYNVDGGDLLQGQRPGPAQVLALIPSSPKCFLAGCQTAVQLQVKEVSSRVWGNQDRLPCHHQGSPQCRCADRRVDLHHSSLLHLPQFKQAPASSWGALAVGYAVVARPWEQHGIGGLQRIPDAVPQPHLPALGPCAALLSSIPAPRDGGGPALCLLLRLCFRSRNLRLEEEGPLAE
mmetsp:Transcript_107751/g.315049  ORF Transcript_107751/g.315049 Transcript_107751/m.315049 type:complete len:222 (-) Transcript_107751:88-753(-)